MILNVIGDSKSFKRYTLFQTLHRIQNVIQGLGGIVTLPRCITCATIPFQETKKIKALKMLVWNLSREPMKEISSLKK